MGIDSYYTPTKLAEEILIGVDFANVKSVADFCVGDGELLRAAEKKCPNITFFGIDISLEAIDKAALKHSNWNLNQCDFLNSDSRNQIPELESGFDLILLNPPFSCIGGTVYEIELNQIKYKASTSLLFLVIALNYLHKDGKMFAILPKSTAYSERDRKLWEALEDNYNLNIISENDTQYFKGGCAPNVIIVSLNDFNVKRKKRKSARLRHNLKGLEIFRGKLSMNEASLFPGEDLVIHTTNIKENTLVDLSVKVSYEYSIISGPAVLIPRVGKPSKKKIYTLLPTETYVLSDCIIAIKTKSLADSKNLVTRIFEHWERFTNLYHGTGAVYTTIEKVKSLFGC